MDHSNDSASFGFSAEQKAKQDAKYNSKMEKDVVSWMNKVVGSGVQGGGPLSLQSSLKSLVHGKYNLFLIDYGYLIDFVC